MRQTSIKSLKTLCNLLPEESPASWRHGVAMSDQDAETGKIGHFVRATRVGFRGDLAELTLNSWDLISPLVPCIGLWLAVTLAACCSPRDSKKCKIGQRDAHHKLQTSR